MKVGSAPPLSLSHTIYFSFTRVMCWNWTQNTLFTLFLYFAHSIVCSYARRCTMHNNEFAIDWESALDSGSILLLSPCSNSLCVQRLSIYLSSTCVLIPFAVVAEAVAAAFHCNTQNADVLFLLAESLYWLRKLVTHLLLIELKYVSNDVIGISPVTTTQMWKWCVIRSNIVNKIR